MGAFTCHRLFAPALVLAAKLQDDECADNGLSLGGRLGPAGGVRLRSRPPAEAALGLGWLVIDWCSPMRPQRSPPALADKGASPSECLCGVSTAVVTPRRGKLLIDISRRSDREAVVVCRRSSLACPRLPDSDGGPRSGLTRQHRDRRGRGVLGVP